MNQSDQQIRVGSLAGTGAAINVELGFVPRYVKVFNPSDAGSLFPTIEWFKGMAAASGLKTLKSIDSGATGNASSAYVTTNGISEYAGAASPVTLSGTCAVALNGTVVTGSSTKFTTEVIVGDIINIGGVTRRVVSIASATSLAVDLHYLAAQSGITSFNMNGKGAGFTIGADADVNASGETVYYLAVK